jgi:hypothetical protein
VDTFFVNNDDAFTEAFLADARRSGRDNSFLVDAQIGRGDGHGTKMAIIAGGKVHGVAPNANLYLLKVKGQWNKGTSTAAEERNGSVQPKALITTLGVIRNHIRNRLATDTNTRSVINMSWGKLCQFIHPSNFE